MASVFLYSQSCSCCVVPEMTLGEIVVKNVIIFLACDLRLSPKE